MRIIVIVLCVVISGLSVARAEVVGQAVDYSAGDTVLKGFLAYDDAIKGPRPGILVVHEWWGHNDYARQRAKQLAQLGYTALAVDMYGDGKQASHPDDAGKFSSEVRNNIDMAKSRFMAALARLRQHPATDPERIAAIGYCFGGAVVLQMAREGVDLDGVVSFHGGLGTSRPAQEGGVKAKILVAHGEADPFVPQEQIAQFREEMRAAKVDFQFKVYPGAKHAFTNPGANAMGKKFDLPLEYNAAADQASWADMQAFFRDIFDH